MDKIEFYKQMLLNRTVEEALLKLFSLGELNGTVHTSIGQEACDVGIIASLDKEIDVIFSNHRAHGHYLSYTDDVEGLIAEIMGKESGVCGGVGGSQHIHRNNMYTNGIQGGIVPSAIGAAFAEKQKKSNAIVLVFLGDGTMGQGIVYEGFNISSLWSLPVLFILEDNQYAQTTPKESAHAGELSSRSKSFNIESNHIHATSVEKVHAASCRAVGYVRQNCKPYFLHVETNRFAPHSKGDDTRPEEEIKGLYKSDPLEILANEIGSVVRVSLKEEIERRVGSIVEKLTVNNE